MLSLHQGKDFLKLSTADFLHVVFTSWPRILTTCQSVSKYIPKQAPLCQNSYIPCHCQAKLAQCQHSYMPCHSQADWGGGAAQWPHTCQQLKYHPAPNTSVLGETNRIFTKIHIKLQQGGGGNSNVWESLKLYIISLYLNVLNSIMWLVKFIGPQFD